MKGTLMKRFAFACCVTIGFVAPTLAQAPKQDAEAAVRIEKDVAYLGPDRQEKCDLYLPAKPQADGRLPGAVVIIHGGGWVGGDKGAKREINIGETLAKNGYVAMSVNYQLGKPGQANAAWPQNLHDCKTAVRWLRKNADHYQFDGARIGAIGGSAGGHLATMLGVTDSKDGLDPAGPFGDVSCQVQAVVDMYGPTQIGGDPKTSPIRYLDKADPPILVLHGTADKTVPVAVSESFDKELEKAGVRHELVIVEGAPHTFDLQPKQRDLRPLVLKFFDLSVRSVQSRRLPSPR